MRAARALALGLCLAGAGPVAGAPPAAPDASVDALPAGPSPHQRLDEIRRRVQAAVAYPPRARELGLEGVTRIQFEIGADGLAREVATVESSGHALLDRAAERGALDAGRLPPLYGRIRIPVRFDLRGADPSRD
jgi:TonB family protein